MAEPTKWARDFAFRVAMLMFPGGWTQEWATERLPLLALALDEARRQGIAGLGFGEIIMMSEQRNKPGLPPRWCALARGRKGSAFGDTEEEARRNALAVLATKENDR